MKIKLVQNGLCTTIDNIEETLHPPTNGFYWIDASLFDLDVLQQMFGLHDLAIEDCIDEEEQRPKLEIYHDHYFIVINSIQFSNQDILLREVNLFLGKHYLITVAKHEVAELQRIPSLLREEEIHAPDFLLYHLVDQIVESYFDVIDQIENIIEDWEEEILLHTHKSQLIQIIGLRREILYAKRMIGPQRDLVEMLNKKELVLIDDHLQKYFSDIHENTVKIAESFETFRDLIGNLREAYQSSLSGRANDIMRVFTVLTTIFMPLTIITGIYGMNFTHMPELNSPYGYPIVLIAMGLLATGMFIYFKKRDWL